MSHEIETMFSVREKPWHYEMTKERTKIIQEAPTAKEAIIAAGLDWRIEGKPVFDEKGRAISGYRANERSTDKSILGIVSSRYSVVQNEDAFSFLDGLTKEQLHYETAGSLRGGKQIWLLGRMPDCEIAGDKVEPYICFTNSHDGMGSVRCCMTPIRVVCNNTLNYAFRGAPRSWAAPHRGDIGSKMREARETLGLAVNYLELLDTMACTMADCHMTEGEMRDALDKMLPIDEGIGEYRKKNIEQTKESIMVCTLAPDLIKFANSKWQFLNAVADYVGHSKPLRKTQYWKENRWASIITGNALMDSALRAVNAA